MNTQQPKKMRGRQAPSYRLSDAIAALHKVGELGNGPFSREILAQAMGHKSASGTANTKIGTLTHFGLLDVKKGAYTLSPVGSRILIPESEEDRAAAIAEAALSPALYSELVSDFVGKALPTLLPNVLVHKYGVLQSQREDVAKIFRESMEDAGLLRHGVLHSDTGANNDVENMDDSTSVRSNGDPVAHGKAERSTAPTHASADQQAYTVALNARGRIATVHLPTPVTASDLRRLEAWAKLMKELTESENDEAELGA